MTVSEVIGIKQTRKKAESDLQLLANRIALLRTEEQKALSKVSETKARANEILEVKRRNEELLQEKIQKSRDRERQMRENRTKAQREREERQRRLALSKKAILDSKRSIAGSTKEQERRLLGLAQQQRDQAMQDKWTRAEEIRKKRAGSMANKEQATRERERKAQEDYLQRIQLEADRKREAEHMIAMLEKEERDLINRLKKTQELQEKAYVTLQKTLES